MRQLFYKPSALKVIKKFNHREYVVFADVFGQLRELPEAGRYLKGSLRGLRKWKFKIGNIPYRIVYQLDDETITIIAVGKRKDFYELLD